LHSNPNNLIGWEQISTSGRDIGKISHHSCAAVSAKEVIFVGGLKGEDSNKQIFLLNLANHAWSNLAVKVS